MDDKNAKPLTPKEFSLRVNRSTRTLRRWDAEKLFVARRTPGGTPFYIEEDVTRFLNPENQLLTA